MHKWCYFAIYLSKLLNLDFFFPLNAAASDIITLHVNARHELCTAKDISTSPLVDAAL